MNKLLRIVMCSSIVVQFVYDISTTYWLALAVVTTFAVTA
jgi:hypothetical protein